jgi:hypothetical protein
MAADVPNYLLRKDLNCSCVLLVPSVQFSFYLVSSDINI